VAPLGVDDRHEPLPGLAGLPAYVWRRLPRAGRIAVVLAAVGAVVLAVLLAPTIQESKKERADQEARDAARAKVELIAGIKRAQRPRYGHGAAAGSDLGARGTLMAATADSIRADASKRAAAGEFNGPIKRVECQPYPRSATGPGALDDPAQRVGRFSCIAVTSDIPATSGNRAGIVGHPYRARVDFGTGRYAFCKIRGRPGELAVQARKSVAVPRVCGG
jgi:hypothetical protein